MKQENCKVNIDEISKIIPYCISCGRHCSLDSLHCTKGQEFLLGFLYTMNIFEGGHSSEMDTQSKYSILYFSGTGNSAFVAKKASEATGGEVISINDMLKTGISGDVSTGEDLVICAPVYAWRIPHVAEAWLKSAVFPSAKRVWFLLTFGSDAGNAYKYNRKLAEEMKLEYMGTAGFKMPCNHITMFDVPEKAEADEKIAAALPLIEAAAAEIAAGKILKEPTVSIADRMKSGMINTPFYSLFIQTKPFYTTDDCIGCGKCALLCPLNNISIENKKPVWGQNCTHCMSCICRCPQGAIEYGWKSLGKPRYHLD